MCSQRYRGRPAVKKNLLQSSYDALAGHRLWSISSLIARRTVARATGSALLRYL